MLVRIRAQHLRGEGKKVIGFWRARARLKLRLEVFALDIWLSLPVLASLFLACFSVSASTQHVCVHRKDMAAHHQDPCE
jgi:hypothetical protein